MGIQIARTNPYRASIETVVIGEVISVDVPGNTVDIQKNDKVYTVTPPGGFDLNNLYSGAMIVGGLTKSGSDYTASYLDFGILRYHSFLSSINFSWGGVQKYFSINPADAPDTFSGQGYIAGCTIEQPTGGSGTMVMRLADDSGSTGPRVEGDTFFSGQGGEGTISYCTAVAEWPTFIRDLFTTTQLDNAFVDFTNNTGLSITATGVVGWAEQSSWFGNLKYRASTIGGLGRPNGNLLGYLYIPHVFFLSGHWRL